MSEEQTPVEQVPPASRLGEFVGWSLLVLAVACFVAFIVAAVQADAASKAADQASAAFRNVNPDHVDAAYAAIVATESAYREAKVLTYLLLSASVVLLSLIPGLLYAMKPSLLGGPWGRLLRPSSARLAGERLALRLPPRRHPVTFYQGIGLILNGLPWICNGLFQAVASLHEISFELVLGLGLLTVLLFLTFVLVGYPLLGQATWWYTRRSGIERGQERPQA